MSFPPWKQITFKKLLVLNPILILLLIFVASGSAVAQDRDDNGGTIVADSALAVQGAWQILEEMSPLDKDNAILQLECDAVEAAEIESLWNSGNYSTAINVLHVLEDGGLQIAFGISWKQPKSVSSLSQELATPKSIAGGNVQVGSRSGPIESHSDFDAESGNLFIVSSSYDTNSTWWGWNVYISSDHGQTWQETYDWRGVTPGTYPDVSAAVVDDFLYVGYVSPSTLTEARLRRLQVSDGAVDNVFGNTVIFNKGSNIKEVSLVANADDNDNRLYYVTILADNTLTFHWAADVNTTPAWTEDITGVANAGSGLDAAYNINAADPMDSNFLYISYIASDGTQPVKVLKLQSNFSGSVITTSTLRTEFTGLDSVTAISAYQDTVICVFEYADSEASTVYGIRYAISYDDGDNWATGYPASPEEGTDYYYADVTARGGQGLAIIYLQEDGSFDPVWTTTRAGYSGGPWTSAVQINDIDSYTARASTINWFPPQGTSSSAYGYNYMSNLALYFDRSDDVGSKTKGDLTGDGTADVLIRNNTFGVLFMVEMDSGTAVFESVSALDKTAWGVAGIGDLTGDGTADVLIRHTTFGALYMIEMDGGTPTISSVTGLDKATWDVEGVADLTGDGTDDILIRHTTAGVLYMVKMDSGTAVIAPVTALDKTTWNVEGMGDLTGDGTADILIRNNTFGVLFMVKMDSGTATFESVSALDKTAWGVAGVGDLTGDGTADILIRHTTFGTLYMINMDGVTPVIASVTGLDKTTWDVENVSDLTGDGKEDILIRHTTAGVLYMVKMDSGTAVIAPVTALDKATWNVMP